MKLNEVFVAAMHGGPLLARFTAAVWSVATRFSHDNQGKRAAWANRALLVDGKAQAYASVMIRMAFSENEKLRSVWSQEQHGEQFSDEEISNIVLDYAAFMADAEL